MEQLAGVVEHIIFHNEENGYTVLEMKSEGNEIVCVGNLPVISEGEFIKAEGEYVDHFTYGRQFKIFSFTVEVPEDADALERYLGSGAIKGVGPKLAHRIVSKFQDDTLRILEEDPDRLAEVKGISVKKAADIYKQFHDKQDMRQAIMFMSNYGITMTYAVRIYNQYGSGLYDIIRENPYQLAEDVSGIGFKLADEIAQKVGVGQESEYRIRSGILYMLMQASHAGHTYLPQNILAQQTADLLGIDEELVGKHLSDLSIDHKIVIKELEGERAVYESSFYYMELSVAKRLKNLNVTYDIEGLPLDHFIGKMEEEENLVLDEMQRIAVREAVRNGVMVITGGPGTGKTTTINILIRYFEYENLEILLAAPTGRAAKRMTEATGKDAQTIHRLLELNGSGEEEAPAHFERNESNPLEADVIIIDEMSMVDINLMDSLLKAVLPGTRLILVGDVNQLPSVGPGNVLKDIINSQCFRVVMLKKIFRQAMESAIVTNAHKINAGIPIDLDVKTPDFFCLKRYDAQSIIGVMIALIRDKLPPNVGASPYEIQVLTPMRKGELGVGNLNTILQQYLNPPSADKREVAHGEGVFREQDKVMQIRNNYQAEWEIVGQHGICIEKGVGIFNGDTGMIVEINTFAQTLTVEFDECRRVVYTFRQLEELELAYAVTIHKSQGSEYPAVILPLLSGPRLLFNRNLLYTAVTRARKCVVIVGNERTVEDMIANGNEQKRYTSLRVRIEEA